jgi:hypothetical protein
MLPARLSLVVIPPVVVDNTQIIVDGGRAPRIAQIAPQSQALAIKCLGRRIIAQFIGGIAQAVKGGGNTTLIAGQLAKGQAFIGILNGEEHTHLAAE